MILRDPRELDHLNGKRLSFYLTNLRNKNSIDDLYHEKKRQK